MLSGLQEAVMSDGTVDRIAAEALVEKISVEGFGSSTNTLALVALSVAVAWTLVASARLR